MQHSKILHNECILTLRMYTPLNIKNRVTSIGFSSIWQQKLLKKLSHSTDSNYTIRCTVVSLPVERFVYLGLPSRAHAFGPHHLRPTSQPVLASAPCLQGWFHRSEGVKWKAGKFKHVKKSVIWKPEKWRTPMHINPFKENGSIDL